jgi:choline monooxygenase
MTSTQGPLIHPNISRAWTLPAIFYWEPVIAGQEKDRVFGCTWQVVGHHDQVANAGDYFTTQLVGEPLLIARDADHQLRAFYNVCRHRAGPPAEGCGSR